MFSLPVQSMHVLMYTHQHPKFFIHTHNRIYIYIYICAHTHTNRHAFTPKGSILCGSKDVNRIELGEQKEERRETGRTEELLMKGRRQGRNHRKWSRRGMFHQPPDVSCGTHRCQSFYRTESCSLFPSGKQFSYPSINSFSACFFVHAIYKHNGCT